MREQPRTGEGHVPLAPRHWIARQPRWLWFAVALALIWMCAPNVRDFVLGFLDGAAGAR